MGPTCEEHVTKNDPDIWSCKLTSIFFNFYYYIILALSPVHTRVLFDMLQEAYRAKSRRKSLIASKNGQIDFIGLLSTRTTSMPITSTTVETTTFTTDQNETTEIEHIIPAHAVQLDQIFSDSSTVSTLDMNTYEFTEPFFQYDNPTTSVTDIISTTMIIENIPTTAIEQLQTDFSNTINDQDLVNITEESNIMITSTPIHFSNDNNLIDDITTQNLIEETNHSTESVIINTMNPIDLTSSNLDIKMDEDNDDKSYSLDQTITNTSEQLSSIDTTTMSQTLHSQLIYKLCQQFFSHILPNASLSSAAATALSLSSNSPSTNNHTTDVFLSWLRNYLSSSTSTTTTSTVSPLIINDIQTLSIPLQRIDMDDVLHQMNNNIDNEH
jgi:hypothetical protein